MSNKKNLISKQTLDLYLKRIQKINKIGCGEDGDNEFISKFSAVSEQVDNMLVKANINGFDLFCDEPRSMGGTEKAPNPMETLLAALANCLEITAMLYFSFMNLHVDSVKVKVQAYYDKRSLILKNAINPPGFYDICYSWYVNTDEPYHKIQKALINVEKSCPVKWTLKKEHKFHQEIHINKNP